MIRPVRLQLSRRRGFNLQRLSLETNGLPAIACVRPGPWGNAFRGHDAAFAFRDWLKLPGQEPYVEQAKKALRGKNLACFCGLDDSCHCDHLLKIANVDG